ncbi:SSI family serine proteinase inhibitor [Streptomyces sp. NPDC048442]|uniref:SSI family serine proteinase inhibitor n=1 Tax=Streptomyces sp. NPDC048442 TaxID=3154823 RepID=UPI003417BAEB
MHRRRLGLVAASLLAFGIAGPAVPVHAAGGDHLVVTLTRTDGDDGTYKIRCHPARSHGYEDPQAVCDQLDDATVWGRDPFAPVPPDAACTMIYGGPQRAHVTGRWAGRPVDAEFDRTNGCEIARWDRFSRLLQG